jgi:hypothetical protein
MPPVQTLVRTKKKKKRATLKVNLDDSKPYPEVSHHYTMPMPSAMRVWNFHTLLVGMHNDSIP